MRLHQWKAKRSGGRITAYGRDAGGDSAKVPNIDTIEPRAGRVFAVDKDGNEHELVME